MTDNYELIKKTVEITVAKLANSTSPVNKNTGLATADFMQEIYNKLVELNDSSN